MYKNDCRWCCCQLYVTWYSNSVIFRDSSCAVLWYLSSALHLQQPLKRLTKADQKTVWASEFFGRKFYILLHWCFNVHLPETPLWPRIHSIWLCILLTNLILFSWCSLSKNHYSSSLFEGFLQFYKITENWQEFVITERCTF